MSLRDCFITDESGNTSKAKRQIGATKLLTSAEYLAVFFLVLIHYLIIEKFSLFISISLISIKGDSSQKRLYII